MNEHGAGTRVGWIGLGAMGSPMAACVARAGFDVTAYDIDALACSAAQRSGIAIAANPAAVAQASDFVIIVVGFARRRKQSCWVPMASPAPRAPD